MAGPQAPPVVGPALVEYPEAMEVSMYDPSKLSELIRKVFDPSIKGETDRFVYRFVKP